MSRDVNRTPGFQKSPSNYAEFFRDKSLDCIRLARTCGDRTVSHALEAMSMEFMEHANALDEMYSVSSKANTRATKRRDH